MSGVLLVRRFDVPVLLSKTSLLVEVGARGADVGLATVLAVDGSTSSCEVEVAVRNCTV